MEYYMAPFFTLPSKSEHYLVSPNYASWRARVRTWSGELGDVRCHYRISDLGIEDWRLILHDTLCPLFTVLGSD